MNSQQLKQEFIKFFESKGHKRIPNSSLIPENDPSALFINSGMHPIVPYLLGNSHPLGKRLVNYQRAVRTGDIEEVGVTKRHQTFFEMLGEWSLGDYWKKESLEWSIEFIVNILGFDINRLHATIFKGNESLEEDKESIEIWKSIFAKYGIEPTIGDEFFANGESPRIVKLGEKDNLWKVGNVGPCGPCSEIYYDTGFGEDADSRYLEICNNVFMSFYKNENGAFTELKQRNIDVGWGFERLLCIVQNRDENGNISTTASNFETDLFEVEKIWLLGKFDNSSHDYENDPKIRRATRVILDHIRASVMLFGDGVEPSNKDQGYILRRLIRRAVTFGWKYSENMDIYSELAEMFIQKLGNDPEYKYLQEKNATIISNLKSEIKKFESALKNGIKELKKVNGEIISGELAFKLKEAIGLPLEITQEIAENSGKKIDIVKYEELMHEHQEKSRANTEKKFVGGLGDYSPESIRFHTCAHLFLASARKILGEHIHQKGQNITTERLRYDISHPNPITKEQIQEIENLVNYQISRNLKVDFIEVSLDEARKMGAEGVFDDKYAKLEKIKVYRIFDENLPETDENKYASLEICGGPHVPNTAEIKEFGKFKIVKEESSSGGVRRIKALIE